MIIVKEFYSVEELNGWIQKWFEDITIKKIIPILQQSNKDYEGSLFYVVIYEEK